MEIPLERVELYNLLNDTLPMLVSTLLEAFKVDPANADYYKALSQYLNPYEKTSPNKFFVSITAPVRLVAFAWRLSVRPELLLFRSTRRT